MQVGLPQDYVEMFFTDQEVWNFVDDGKTPMYAPWAFESFSSAKVLGELYVPNAAPKTASHLVHHI